MLRAARYSTVVRAAVWYGCRPFFGKAFLDRHKSIRANRVLDDTYIGVCDEEEQVPKVTPDGLLQHRVHEVRTVEARPVIHDRAKRGVRYGAGPARASVPYRTDAEDAE